MLQKVRLKDNLEFDVTHEPFLKEIENGGFDECAKICVMSFNALENLSLEDEISGKSTLLQSVALMSLYKNCIVFCGITTSVQGVNHISIAVFRNGALIDIVDRTARNAPDGFLSGDKIKIFSTDFGRIGLIVDLDVLIMSNWQKVAPNCDCILSIANASDTEFSSVALSISTGFDVPFLLVSNNNISWHS